MLQRIAVAMVQFPFANGFGVAPDDCCNLVFCARVSEIEVFDQGLNLQIRGSAGGSRIVRRRDRGEVDSVQGLCL